MNNLLKQVIDENRKYTNYGQVASYIPELKNAKRSDLGICIIDKDNKIYTAGNYNTKFTIQSISKPIVLAMALMDNDWTTVFSKVGMEPSGDPFNSIMKLETNDTKKPSNPMINAGAIVTTSLIKGSSLEEKEERMLQFFRRLANNDSIGINYEVYKSEKLTGDRNRAMAYLLKNDGFIDGDVEEVLDLYFKQCSIELDCVDLARIGINLAMYGIDIESKERLISEYVNRMNIDDVSKFATQNGISLNEKELNIIFNYIKKEYMTICFGNPRPILDDLKTKINPVSYQKIESLYIFFKEKYGNL